MRQVGKSVVATRDVYACDSFAAPLSADDFGLAVEWQQSCRDALLLSPPLLPDPSFSDPNATFSDPNATRAPGDDYAWLVTLCGALNGPSLAPAPNSSLTPTPEWPRSLYFPPQLAQQYFAAGDVPVNSSVWALLQTAGYASLSAPALEALLAACGAWAEQSCQEAPSSCEHQHDNATLCYCPRDHFGDVCQETQSVRCRQPHLQTCICELLVC